MQHRHRARVRPLATLALCAALAPLAPGCGGASTPDGGAGLDAQPGTDVTPGGDGGSMGDVTPGGDSGATGDAGGDAGAESGLRMSAFRRGVNPGYYGSGIDRRESAQLSRRAGANSIRTTLPEYYLAQWGDRIEVDDYAYYATMGIDHLTCFLIGPSAAHSSAPAGTPDWQLAQYAPRNLYQPIFRADGSVNPENYWAAYVDRVAQNYGDHIDVYEVWNEPDQVGGNWQATQQWTTRPPQPSELIWWHDTVFAYVRALRIAHEVIHRRDPSAQVTVGGVGYREFLNAVLRYTDEPNAGAVTSEYPHTGGSYIDVLSYHYYPVFGGGSSDRGVDGFFESRDAMRAELSAAGLGAMNFVVTESGAPRYALGTYPGGADYAAAYLVKMYALAHFEGMVGVDWFAQGDGAAMGASQDSFQYMGLFYDYSAAQSVSDVRTAPQGSAYAWLAGWLEGTSGDPAALAALALPSSARGAAFARAGGGRLYVLWARTGMTESAAASVAVPASGPVRVRTWTVAGGEQTEMRSPSGGAVMLSLTGMPTVVEAP